VLSLCLLARPTAQKWDTAYRIRNMVDSDGGSFHGFDDGEVRGRESAVGMNRQDDSSKLESLVLAVLQQNKMMLELLSLKSEAQENTAASTSTLLPADPMKYVNKFCGSESSVEAKAWIQSVCVLKELHGLSDNQLLKVATSNLVTSAKDWYFGRLDTITDWESFNKQFKRTFIGQSRMSDLWKAMEGCVQGRALPTCDYFHKKVLLCSELPLSFEEKKNA